MRFFCLALLVAFAGSAAILPETIGPYHRGAVSAPNLADRPIWDEYGLKSSESSAYENGNAKFTATVWQLQDTTGAMAAFDWQRLPQSQPSDAGKLAAQTDKSLLLAYGNYLFSFAGYKPSKEELDAVFVSLTNVDRTVLPTLAGFLPADNLVPNSERYVTGPAGLDKFAPGLPPSTVAFRYGAEGQLGVFHSPKGDITVAIFNYPTHQIAMERLPDFQKVPGAMVKRSGPLVAVTVAPPDPDFAERVLGQVRYQAEITQSEYVPTKHDNIGYIVISAFLLIAILLAFSLVSGFAWGTVRTVLRRGRQGEEADPMITLHLGK